MVVGFRELRRILRDDGCLWLNYGDKYATMKGTCYNLGGNESSIESKKKDAGVLPLDRGNKSDFEGTGLKQGDLIGLAWRLALALQADGWILRSDTIWAKAISFCDKYSGSTMPESVNSWRWEQHRIKVKKAKRAKNGTNAQNPEHEHRDVGSFSSQDGQAQWRDCPGCDKCKPNDGLVLRKGSWRPTRAHEYLFLLTKGNSYYCDMEAVRETLVYPERIYNQSGETKYDNFDNRYAKGLRERESYTNPSGRNLRDVWAINPQPWSRAHYATFPESLIEPIIKVSTSQKGVCPKCGSQWARIVDRPKTPFDDTRTPGKHTSTSETKLRGQMFDLGICSKETTTLGWRPTCKCYEGPAPIERDKTVPAVVYDPFMGSGTVAAVAAKLGRNYCGSDLREDYLENQAKYRIQEAETGVTISEQEAGQMAMFDK